MQANATSLNSTVEPEQATERGPNEEKRLLAAIAHAAHLLPAQGPINVFIHHNTLHGFEDLTFAEGVKKGGRIFGCQPYMSEDRYRDELHSGRIRLVELESVVRDDLGGRAQERVLGSCTRQDLWLAMLQYPLRYGPTGELRWFMAKTDALRRIRRDAPVPAQLHLVAETRDWVMRDLRTHVESQGRKRTELGPHGASLDVADLIMRFGGTRLETWSNEAWTRFTLWALWRVCRKRISGLPESTPPPELPVRHRDLLLQATGQDADLPVHQLLISFCGAFLDQGVATWQLPGREDGFFSSFCALYRSSFGSPEPWRRGLSREIARLERNEIGPAASILESLTELGVPEADWEEYLASTLLALRGWGGILHFLEERPDRAVYPVAPGALVEFLAIRLLLDRLSLAHTASQTLGYRGSLSALRQVLQERIGIRPLPSVEQRAFLVFQLAQVLSWTPEVLNRLEEADWIRLLRETEEFSSLERRRLFHLAYEQRFYRRTLDALSVHNRESRSQPASPSFQAFFCIDEREESLRRHVEEVDPEAVTYSIAGFYFVTMYYRGLADVHFVPLCPAVIRPQHWVVEKVSERLEDPLAEQARKRRAYGIFSHWVHVGSRSFAIGAMLSGALGVLASLPLVLRTMFPRLMARLTHRVGQLVIEPLPSRLQLERSAGDPGTEGEHIGFTLDEMLNIAERVLRDSGLTSGFSRLVLMFGHGSTSMNNPHESAHDCGACGGSRGGPNGRAIAQILNHLQIRQRLQERGLTIPAETWFVGGMHNTSSETVTFYDVDQIPDSHKEEFQRVKAKMEEAADRDAHERCRRFRSAALDLSPLAARQHVEGRAEDLSQVRPEWGHATNAFTVVGRRSRTRGLFLDRRAFLNSYDPSQDDANATILTRILDAALPVCAGISLEYYFSYVDNFGYGCGTKLPHNITGLLGVMDGAASDLRTGLPWQMVEIHEPMRHLFVIETTPETMLAVMDRRPTIARLVRNGWVPVAVIDPHGPGIKFYRDGAFHDHVPKIDELPHVPSSSQWYSGCRDHLDFIEIGH